MCAAAALHSYVVSGFSRTVITVRLKADTTYYTEFTGRSIPAARRDRRQRREVQIGVGGLSIEKAARLDPGAPQDSAFSDATTLTSCNVWRPSGFASAFLSAAAVGVSSRVTIGSVASVSVHPLSRSPARQPITCTSAKFAAARLSAPFLTIWMASSVSASDGSSIEPAGNPFSRSRNVTTSSFGRGCELIGVAGRHGVANLREQAVHRAVLPVGEERGALERGRALGAAQLGTVAPRAPALSRRAFPRSAWAAVKTPSHTPWRVTRTSSSAGRSALSSLAPAGKPFCWSR